AAEQLLIASATTEGGIVGNLRNSICAVEVDGDTCLLEKDATVISYGSHAYAILITSRAHAQAASSDQVLRMPSVFQTCVFSSVYWSLR
ncbi:acyl-CoA dehydrogenase, partial [Rhizobium leguminosarum]